jgi:hypothetical protein
MEGLLKGPSASLEARIAFTEDFFRKINLPHAESAYRDQDVAELQCECWQETCSERISLPTEEWAVVRSQGNRFAVAPHHVAERFEAVLTVYPSFWMIEKFGEAGDIADELAKLERAATAAVRRQDVARHPRFAHPHLPHARIGATRR